MADTITAAVNTAWMRKHPRPMSRHDVHFGTEAVITKVRDHQAKDAGKRSKAYERDDKETFAVGDIVRRMVARSGKLDAAWSKRLYKVVRIKKYRKVKRPVGYQIAPVSKQTSQSRVCTARRSSSAFSCRTGRRCRTS